MLSTGNLLSGIVTLTFTVEGTGFVSAVGIESNTTESHGLGVCVSQAVRSLVFDPTLTGDSVSVTYPFTFTPSQSAVADVAQKRTSKVKAKAKSKASQLKVTAPKF